MRAHFLATDALGRALTVALLASTIEKGAAYLGGGVWKTDDAHEAAVRDHLRRHGFAVDGCAEPEGLRERLGGVVARALIEEGA